MGYHNERRQAPRLDLRRPATLINSDGVECKAVLLDLSGTGIRLGLEESLRIGELVTLRIDDTEEVRARICWCLGSEAGGILLDRPGEEKARADEPSRK
jgi:hypothetical protein